MSIEHLPDVAIIENARQPWAHACYRGVHLVLVFSFSSPQSFFRQAKARYEKLDATYQEMLKVCFGRGTRAVGTNSGTRVVGSGGHVSNKV
jgi:hypothetical protein